MYLSFPYIYLLLSISTKRFIHIFFPALADALPLIGISPIYHMRDVRKNGHQDAWNTLLSAKKEGKPISTEDFDAILGSYAVYLLLPFPIF
jgi:hypothetical protein